MGDKVKEVKTMAKELTLAMLKKGIKECESYHKLHEFILHELGETTRTDEARHEQNLYRASLMRPDNQNRSRMKYEPNKFPRSRIEDEFKEFRREDEVVVVR